MSKPSVIVIGAGFTGVATAHDLAMRGFDVTVVERGPIANGTSGRTHGLLHSGGRYAVTDKESAIECIDENQILRAIVPEIIEPNGGLFVAITDSDAHYRQEFIQGCEECHIPIEEISAKQALALEPALNPHIQAAIRVPDATFDPLRLALAFAASAKMNGAKFRLYTEVEEFLLDGHGNVVGIRLLDRTIEQKGELRADLVVNSTGAWAGEVANLAGASVPITPSPGIMIAFDRRLSERVINHLCLPTDGDLILPQRRMMVVGTTSFVVSELDYIPVVEEQIRQMVESAVLLLPAIAACRQRGVFMAARPLVGLGNGRSLARTFKCFDHKVDHNIDGLVTIVGGKATTMRLMAEKTTDLVCQKLGVSAVCQTRSTPLASYRQFYALPN
jgi:glycerol-3-phosphate dehydrogenase